MDQPDEKSGERGMDGSPIAAATGSIDQIRDIIFGSQMREYERRFQHLEERTRQRIEELHAEVGNRLGTIEAFARREIDAQDERLKSEQSARSDALRALSNEIGDALRALSRSIEAQAEKQALEVQDLQRQMLDLSNRLSEEIRQKHGEASQRLDQSVLELENAKVARTALSDLLLDMAARLSDEVAAKLGRAADPLKHD